MSARPPRLAIRLLAWLLPGGTAEHVIGDLVEEYGTVVRPSRSRLAADLWFWHQTLASYMSFLRRGPPAIRNPAEAHRDGHIGGRQILHDLRYALRSFRSGRSALVMGGVVLALAIGAGTTTYSVVAGVVLRSLPFKDAERLVMVRSIPREVRTRDRGGGTMSAEAVNLVLSTDGLFEEGAYYYGSGSPVLTGLGEPERMHAFTVGPGFFQVAGTRPLLGRTLVDADVTGSGTIPVVVSHGFWMGRLGGTPDALGRTLTLDDRVYQVVGVMPPGFEEIGRQADLWLPERELPVGADATGYPAGFYWLLGRLAPGVTIETALARLDARFDTYAADRDQPIYAQWGANIQPVRDMLVGDVRKPLLILLGAVALVLLIACGNLASVLLARGLTRRREIAVRLSLGGGRLRVGRQLVLEAMLLAVGAGVVGTALALWAVPASVSLVAADLPRLAEIGVDWRVLGAGLAASLLTGLLAGVFPALLSVRESVAEGLKDGAAGSGISSWRTRLGESLVVLQVGLGTVLTVGATLLVLTFVNLTTVDFGFEPSRIVSAELRLPEARYGASDAPEAFVATVFERLHGLPGVQAVAASTGMPFSGGAIGTVEIPGGQKPEDAPPAWIMEVSDGYAEVLGLRLVQGGWVPDAGGAGLVLVDEAFRQAYFPGQDPLGRTIQFYGNVRAQVAGVVSDVVQRRPGESPQPHIYGPLTGIGRRVQILARSTPDGGIHPGALRNVIREIDPLLPIDRVGTLQDLAWETVSRQRYYAVILGTFSALALLITALGVYGMSAYSVSSRIPEIGIRMALGASASRMRSRTVGRAALLGLLGALLGLGAAYLSTGLLEALLFGVTTTELGVFLISGGALALVSVAAAYPPALRASRVDPMEVLRTE